MNYLAMAIRVVIILIGIFMMVQNPTPQTPPFCSGLAFVLIGVYFTLLATIGAKKMHCPFLKGDK